MAEWLNCTCRTLCPGLMALHGYTGWGWMTGNAKGTGSGWMGHRLLWGKYGGLLGSLLPVGLRAVWARSFSRIPGQAGLRRLGGAFLLIGFLVPVPFKFSSIATSPPFSTTAQTHYVLRSMVGGKKERKGGYRAGGRGSFWFAKRLSGISVSLSLCL